MNAHNNFVKVMKVYTKIMEESGDTGQITIDLEPKEGVDDYFLQLICKSLGTYLSFCASPELLSEKDLDMGKHILHATLSVLTVSILTASIEEMAFFKTLFNPKLMEYAEVLKTTILSGVENGKTDVAEDFKKALEVLSRKS